MRVQPSPEQVCGNCRKFEPSRLEPKRYGYCGPHERIALERRDIRALGHVVGVGTPCFLVVWRGNDQYPAFEARRG